MTVTQVGLKQNVYMGTQNVAAQPVQHNVPVSQPIPVGQPVPVGQTVPVAQNQPIPVGQPNAYTQNAMNSTDLYPKNSSNINDIFPSTNPYQDDVMMNGIDFLEEARKLGLLPNVEQPVDGAIQTNLPVEPQTQQPIPQVATNPAPQNQFLAFTGKAATNSELTNALVTPERKDGSEKKSSVGPAIGATVGFALPFMCNKARLGKFLTKDLLVKAPVISAGGLCVGGMVDGLTASAKKLEANNAEDKALAQMMDAKAS